MEGALGEVQNLGQLVNLLRPHFLPASMAQPPTASPSATGHRVIAITTATQGRPKLMDGAILQLASGTLTWDFAVNFPVAPSVTAVPQGQLAGSNPGLYVFSVSPNEVIVNSSNNTDNRWVHLSAIQTSTGGSP